MTQNTQTQPKLTLTVNRDGAPDPDWLAEKRRERYEALGNAMLNSSVDAVTALTQYVGRGMLKVVTDASTSVRLDIFDSIHDTHLRDEFFAQKGHIAETAMRQTVGL